MTKSFISYMNPIHSRISLLLHGMAKTTSESDHAVQAPNVATEAGLAGLKTLKKDMLGTVMAQKITLLASPHPHTPSIQYKPTFAGNGVSGSPVRSSPDSSAGWNE